MLCGFLILLLAGPPKTWTGHAGVQVGDDAYFAGGMQWVNEGHYLPDLWKLDCQTKKWETLSGPKTPRGMAAMAHIKGQLVLAGGLKWPDTALSSVEAYSIKSRRWLDLPAMRQARSRFALVEVGDRIYALGGLGEHGNMGSIEEYDATRRIWTTVGSLSVPRHGLAAAAIGGRIFVAGGYSDEGLTSRFEVFEPATSKTTRLPDMPEARGFFGLVLANGGLLAFGGRQTEVRSAFYNPKTKAWSKRPQPEIERDRFVSFIRQGELWVIGGETKQPPPILQISPIN